MARGLATRYAVRNLLHYRTKYGIAFVLIAAFAACLALSLFAFNGFWRQASVYARAWGDILFSVYVPSLDEGSPPDASGRPPSRRLESSAIAFFKDELKAERVVATSFIGGDAYAPGGSWSVTVTSLERYRQIVDVDLAAGEYPGIGEVIVPNTMRRSLDVGAGITFVYKNSDLIVNSIRLRVSGFFLPTSDTSELVYATQAQLEQLDEGRVPDRYHVYLSGMGGKRLFLEKSEYDGYFRSFNAFLTKLSGSSRRIGSGYYTARQRYSNSEQLIRLFEFTISIFLAALVVVALATIINVLFITVVDRIRIIGTFMAYGMTRRRAILLLSSEMLAFSLAACTVGILAALAAVGPVSSLKFTADNWTIAVILGGKRSLTIVPALWAVGATYLAGMLLPFLTAALSVARMLRGEVVKLLHYAK